MNRHIRRIIRVTLVCLCGLLAVGTVGGWVFERVQRARAPKAHPPPGRLVMVEGRAMHLDCRGRGSPTVVLEAGMDPIGSLAWSLQHDALAQTTRTCAYDRAGMMWSEPGPKPRNGEQVAAELRELLAASDEEAPYVIVAHSFGGPHARIFAGLNPELVAGLLLVDSSHPEQLERAPDEVQGQLRPPAWFGWLMPIGRELGVLRFIGPLAPTSPLSEQQKAAAWAYAPRSNSTTLEEYGAFDATMRSAARVTTLGGLPLVVMTAEDPPQIPPDMSSITQDQADAVHGMWIQMQQELTALSTRGVRIPVHETSHYIQFDRPELVVETARELIELVREEAQANRD